MTGELTAIFILFEVFFCNSSFTKFVLFFPLQGAVSFPVITLPIEFQFAHPGTVLKTKEQELPFVTKIFGILGFICS